MTKMKKRITKHAKKRLRERTGVYNNYTNLLRNVLKKGIPSNHYTGAFYSYLASKQNGSGIKVYKEKIYIFSPNKKKFLLTTFPVPDMYLPTSKYLINETRYNIVSFLLKNEGVNIILTLTNGDILQGTIISCEKYQRDRFDFELEDGTILKIFAHEILKYELADDVTINN